MEISNLPEKEFRITGAKGLGKTVEKMREMCTKNLGELKSKRTEMSDTLAGVNSRVAEAKEQISGLEGRVLEVLPQSEVQRKEWKEMKAA